MEEITGLERKEFPSVTVSSTDHSGEVDFKSILGKLAVIFFYPATGVPGAGCTPESCSFRDFTSNFNSLGASIFGISTQPIEEQIEFKIRMQIQYPLINGSLLNLNRQLKLPTFKIEERIFYKRFTLVVRNNVIAKVFYNISNAENHASEVLSWLHSS